MIMDGSLGTANADRGYRLRFAPAVRRRPMVVGVPKGLSAQLDPGKVTDSRLGPQMLIADTALR